VLLHTTHSARENAAIFVSYIVHKCLSVILCHQALTFLSAQLFRQSSWMTFSTLSFRSFLDMWDGRRREAEKLRFSRTVKLPVTISSCREKARGLSKLRLLTGIRNSEHQLVCRSQILYLSGTWKKRVWYHTILKFVPVAKLAFCSFPYI